ncbi:hypothetical protein B0H63DRAFT_189104 [Podospora didyma]|uniref:Uncharacterized protein n=1 Tax=Podospora didyma TaxID=330526 RepID=A0AAE0NQK7_9PEZI|nr:hypothetical protein B0H63DRAFT_189104 [Podospora didyma]
MPRTLTTADIAFLLCTSLQQQHKISPAFRLSLTTNYGLCLDLRADEPIALSLQPPRRHPPLDPDLTPRLTNRARFIPPPPSDYYYHHHHDAEITSSGSIDAILLSPTTPSGSSFSLPSTPLFLPPQSSSAATNNTIAPPQSPEVECPALTSTSHGNCTNSTTTGTAKRDGYKYRVQRSSKGGGGGGGYYLWYISGWAGNPPVGSRHVRDEDIEARYSSEWFDAFLDWTERAERAAAAAAASEDHGRHHQQGQGGNSPDEKERKEVERERGSAAHGRGHHHGHPFADEGEGMLWMVEGLLLVCWLALQTDVAAVEYQPEDEVWVLEKGNIGGVVEGFLDAMRGE